MWTAETKYILKRSEQTNLTWLWLLASSANMRSDKNWKLIITLTAAGLLMRCLLQCRKEHGTLLSHYTQTKPHENRTLVSHCTLTEPHENGMLVFHCTLKKKEPQEGGTWVCHYTLNLTKTTSVCHCMLTKPHENGTSGCHCTRTKTHETGSRSDVQRISFAFSKPYLHLYVHKNTHWPLSYISRIHFSPHHVCALIPNFLPSTPMYPK